MINKPNGFLFPSFGLEVIVKLRAFHVPEFFYGWAYRSLYHKENMMPLANYSFYVEPDIFI